ncbi:MAG TPA: RnfABCDGE type electron transport complex subunit D [Woeseiaceae bacterium]
MLFARRSAPFIAPQGQVTLVMRQVLFALLPAALAHVYFFGPGLLFNVIIATIFCLATEAAALQLRNRPALPALQDYSAIVTAVLLAFALPPLTPWWVTATASVFAIGVAKHLYGGIGYNIFNPAMAGYVVVLLAFPFEMNFWTAPHIGDLDYQHLGVLQSLGYTLTGSLPDGFTFDALTRATPLDAAQSGFAAMQIFEEIHQNPLMGDFAGRGWEWIANFVAIGGLWLLYRGIIRWHIPVAVILGVTVPATFFYLFGAGANASPGFHLFGGATLLCAFFIATDPVSAATSPRGRIIYGLGIGLLIYAIRRWGSYADGVAFAVLLMNMAAPAIDYFTVPRIAGHDHNGKGDDS